MWSNKPDKIKRTTLIADYINGGLKMLDIRDINKKIENTFEIWNEILWANKKYTNSRQAN